METDAREFGLFLDGLRIDRNFSREELCDGIMSLSQYKRYLRGDTSIPNGKLTQIADRLKFSISEIHTMYRFRQDTQFKKIKEIYKNIKLRDFVTAQTLTLDMKNEVILTEYNKLFFDYCFIIVQYNLKLVSDIHVLGMLSELITYPDCMKNESFNWLEIQILFHIVTISAKTENYEPANLMYELLTSDSFKNNFLEETSTIPLMYANISQIMGRQKKYIEVTELTEEGIDYCRRNEISSALSRLYYLNAFAYYDLSELDEALESARKAFMLIYIEDSPEMMKIYKKSFEAKFDMKLEDLIEL